MQFDYIVVGAGTAGALMANRLSAGGQHRVLLLEAGGKDNYPWIHIPVGYLYCIDNPRTDWRFRTQPDAGLNGRSLIYPRGKTLGGCSSINGMIYMRGQARDYAQWAQFTGDEAWNWQNCLKDFIAHESNHRYDNPYAEEGDSELNRYHGNRGEWRVEKQRLKWDILEAFSQAAQQAGIPASEDFNRGNNFGVGYFEVNQRQGWRWNTAKAFLHPVLGKRHNLVLWTHAQVKRLSLVPVVSGGLRCAGVEVLHDGELVQVQALREVVLCAGAIGTPQILQLSGIGPAEVLARHGVEVKLHKPGVGANLQDHLQIRSVYKVHGVKTLNTLANSLWGKARIGMEYLFKRSGPMSMAPSQLGAFTKSSPAQ
ncbi:MAG TPA: GMC family oxidoreductase N-terminal domain-containing protein, partial [Limnobacter sp.]|nr:GMC family oxidoreductase N-terminal domain-containing protein [Limnobacter sp.]